MNKTRLLLFCLLCPLFGCADRTQEALETWQDLKYGLFIHYGLYSVAGGEWNGERIPYYAEQIMNHARIPVAEYEKLGEGFTAAGWDADSVVTLAREAGMKYIVITTKHHDGFNLYHSEVSDYNAVDATAAGRDIVGELAEACRKQDMPLGFYYSLPDWHFPGGLKRPEPDSLTDCTTFVNQVYSPLEHITPELEEYIVAQLTELLTNYGDIVTIWFDMGLLTPQQSKRFRDTVKSLQPDCLVSGRIMNNCGDYLTLPDNGNVSGYTDLAWDNPASLYGTWGYRSWCVRPPLSEQIDRQLDRLLKTVSHGGVFLLNIGPTGDGSILEYEKEVLKGIGEWLEIHDEAVYGTDPSPFPVEQEGVYVTRKENRLYVISRTRQPVVLQYLHNEITAVYPLNDPEQRIDYRRTERDLLFEPTSDVTVVEYTGPISVGLPEVAAENDAYILTPENGITHAAFDASGYVTTQSDSYKTWRLSDVERGSYTVFVEYLPAETANRYRFTFGDRTVDHVLPGVDAMWQTCILGDIAFEGGDTDVMLNLASRKDPLEPLGLDLKRIVIRKSLE